MEQQDPTKKIVRINLISLAIIIILLGVVLYFLRPFIEWVQLFKAGG